MAPSILRVVARASRVLPKSGLLHRGAVRASVTSAPRAAAKDASSSEPKELKESKENTTTTTKQDQGGEGQDVTWLWKASREQMMMAEGHKRGTRWTVFGWRMSTPFSLGHGFFDSLVEMLSHKLGPLRGVIQYRLEKPWICESPAPRRDVQFIEDRERLKKEVDDLCNTEITYTRTPLWKLIVSPGTKKASFSPFSSLYGQEYDIYFRFHHAFLDHRSMVYCLGCFAGVIHKASLGDFIDARTQLGVHISGYEGLNSKNAVKKELMENEEALELKKSNTKACSKSPLILEAFSRPGGTPHTKHIHRCHVPGVFKKFQDHCAKAEVSVNIGLKAAINAGLVELMKLAGLQRANYMISVTWNCDLRRFIPPYQIDMLGFHQTPVVHLMPTPSNVLAIFWSYTKKLNDQLHTFYVSGEDLQQHIISELMEDPVCPEDYYNNKQFPLLDYAFIYAGNLSPIIRAHSSQFSLSDVYMMSSAHKSPHAMCHQMNTYNGAFFYTLSYDKSYLAEANAELLMDEVMSVIESV